MTREELRIFLDQFYCGCGNPRLASESLFSLLRRYERGHDDNSKIVANDEGVMYLTLYWMTHFGLIDHGGSVNSSWLTELGTNVLHALAREASDEFESLHHVHCVHGFDISDNLHDCAMVEGAARA